MLGFKKEVGVDSNKGQADVEDYPDEREMEDVKLNENRERHWRIVLRTIMGGWIIISHFYLQIGGIYT